MKAELKQQGFEVKEGYFNLWGIEQCPETFELMGTCFFNNPATPVCGPRGALLVG